MNAPKTSELRGFLQTLAPDIRRATAFSALISMLSLASTIYMLQVYDRVITSSSLTTLAMLTLAVLAAYLVMEVLEWVRSTILQQSGERFDAAFSDRVFAAIFEGSLQKVRIGGTQALTDLRSVREFFVSPALMAVMEAPVSVLCLIILFALSPALGWFAVLGAMVQLGIAARMARRTQQPLTEAGNAAISAQVYVYNSLRNAQVIACLGMLGGIQQRWLAKQNRFLKLQASASDHAGALVAASKASQLIQGSALMGIGCWLLLQGSLAGGAGMLIVGSVFGGKVLQPLVQVLTSWKLIGDARNAYLRLDTLLQQIPAATHGMPLPAPKGQVSVEVVTTGAPGSQLPILRNLSFALAAGQCLAVIGPTASGKTTLARLLIGLWQPQAGKVRLDGADVFAWNKAELGPHLGYLPQDVELFEGTVAENIARFGIVDPAKLDAAVALVGLGSLMSELPQGYDSYIGEDGVLLSGGQRQRIGLARAVYGNPQLVVLDEPNASLDEQGDANLLRLLQSLKQAGVTSIVITHRTNVLTVADQILVLKDGSLQAYGPKDQVLAALSPEKNSVVPS